MPTRNGHDAGTRVVHRRYVPYSDAHYAGNLVDGAYSLQLFGDVATEMCIRTDGDEGLFASYSDVQFRSAVRAGDVLEVTAELVKVGTRSRVIDFSVLVVVGGCIGTDAHTVGIDAILNIKGFAGEKGLEYYRELKVVNLGAQVSVPQLVDRAVTEKADAVLVSQVVTQRGAHVHNTKEMSAAFREAFPPEKRPLLVVGGPRFDETMAAELGVDRVFTRGTTPGEVASYLVHRIVEGRRAS